MRFMSMYTPSKDRAGLPPTKEHMAEMAKLIDGATKTGNLIATGGLTTDLERRTRPVFWR